MTILSILDRLAATSSSLEKLAILESERENVLLKKVIVAALNPFTNYYIKKIPPYERYPEGLTTLDHTLSMLAPLAERKVTGTMAINYLFSLFCGVKEDDAEVLQRIIERDLKCGVADSTVNKVWPGLIPTFEVMLCHKDISGIKYPAFAQCKADGARCHLHWDGKNATAMSRAGKEFLLHGMLNESAGVIMVPGETMDGELLVVDSTGCILPRHIGNGILNKANKGTITPEEANNIIFVPWDIVDETGTIIYKDRWENLESRFGGNGAICAPKFRKIETEIVNNVEEAQEFFERMLAQGQEGAVLKNFDNLWAGKRVKSCGKMKAEETADLRIKGLVEGTGKYVGMMGAMVCETRCEGMEVSIGTGFSDKQRAQYWADYIGAPAYWSYVDGDTGNTVVVEELPHASPVGNIVEVIYNQKIKAKKDKKPSLFLPRFSQERFDKTVANTYEELK